MICWTAFAIENLTGAYKHKTKKYVHLYTQTWDSLSTFYDIFYTSLLACGYVFIILIYRKKLINFCFVFWDLQDNNISVSYIPYKHSLVLFQSKCANLYQTREGESSLYYVMKNTYPKPQRETTHVHLQSCPSNVKSDY